MDVSPPAAPQSTSSPLENIDNLSTPETLVKTPAPVVASQLPDVDATPFLDLIQEEPPVRPAPCLTPAYLSGTPKTIQKLREEYQSRVGGRVMSLSDLLNSGGR